MLPLHLEWPADRPLSLLAIGAHPDDIEIGAGGTLLSLLDGPAAVQAHYVVLTGTPERQLEARQAAEAFLPAVTVDGAADRILDLDKKVIWQYGCSTDRAWSVSLKFPWRRW